MGLYAEVDIINDLGFPEVVEGGNDEIGYETVFVDYSQACAVLVDVFLTTARNLVPVDTGYLRSTINAGTDGETFCWMEAYAHYAQYVEYGTWCMSAQPYFEIALEEACHAATLVAKQALNEAREELAFLLDMDMQIAAEDSGMESNFWGGFGSLLGGSVLLMGLLLFTFPIWGILGSVFNSFNDGEDFQQRNGFIPNVIIT